MLCSGALCRMAESLNWRKEVWSLEMAYIKERMGENMVLCGQDTDCNQNGG